MKTMTVHVGVDRKVLTDVPNSIPMEMLSEAMAQKMHSQSLDRLNERGGLGVTEILWNLGGVSESHRQETQAEVDKLNILVDRFYSRKQVSNPANIPLRREILLDSLYSQRDISEARIRSLEGVSTNSAFVMVEHATLKQLEIQIKKELEMLRLIGKPLDKEMD